MKRLYDFLIAIGLLIIFSIPMVLITLSIRITSRESVFYWSDRVGKHNVRFTMPKFRTMRTDTPEVATHLIENAEAYVTGLGRFLRISSLDELPQLYSILKGDMSLVGPRPALFNQDDLIDLRTKGGVDQLMPGITGWAQVNGRDKLTISEKVALDVEYLNRRSFWFDTKILLKTMAIVINRVGVSH